MRWTLSLTCLAVAVLAIALDTQAQQGVDGPQPAPAIRHEAPTQAPSSGPSVVNPAAVPGQTSAASAPAPAAPAGQVYGLASHPRDNSADVGNGVAIAIPVLGPSLEVDPPIIDMSSDPTSTLSQERLSPRRWMTRAPNREFKGTGYKSFVGSPYKSCEHLCLREATCIAIEFRHSDNRCQLFDRREDSAEVQQSDIAFVRQQASR